MGFSFVGGPALQPGPLTGATTIVTPDTLANQIPMTLRQTDPDQPVILDLQGPDALPRMRLRTDQHEAFRDLVPDLDDTRNVGTDARRFNRVRATTVVSGDLGFEDEACPDCQGGFEVGQALALRVVRQEQDAAGRLVAFGVPIHAVCPAVT